MNFQQEMAWAGVRVIQDNYSQWRGCARKRRYSSETAARSALERTPDKGEPLNVYYCEHCYGFHVGHVSK